MADKFSQKFIRNIQALNVYDTCLTPIAATDKNLGIVYKNSAFTELFGLRKGASIKHIIKSQCNLEDVFDKVATLGIPTLMQTETAHFPALFVIAPLGVQNERLFVIFTADFIFLDESVGFAEEMPDITAKESITEEKAMEFAGFFKQHISPYLDDIIVSGFLDSFKSSEQKSYMQKNVFKLKMLELYIFGMIQQKASEMALSPYAVNVVQLFGELLDAVEKYAPHGYKLTFHIDDSTESILVKNSYILAGFVIGAVLHIFRNCGLKNAEISLERSLDKVNMVIGQDLSGQQMYSPDFFMTHRFHRELDYLRKCAASLDAQIEFNADTSKIGLSIIQEAVADSNLVMFDPMVEAQQLRLIAQATEIFRWLLACFSDN